jgi:hypothetical protein
MIQNDACQAGSVNTGLDGIHPVQSDLPLWFPAHQPYLQPAPAPAHYVGPEGEGYASWTAGVQGAGTASANGRPGSNTSNTYGGFRLGGVQGQQQGPGVAAAGTPPDITRQERLAQLRAKFDRERLAELRSKFSWGSNTSSTSSSNTQSSSSNGNGNGNGAVYNGSGGDTYPPIAAAIAAAATYNRNVPQGGRDVLDRAERLERLRAARAGTLEGEDGDWIRWGCLEALGQECRLTVWG